MFRLSPDRYAPIVRDDWTEDMTLTPATLPSMAGLECRVPKTRVSLWLLDRRSPEAAYEAVALYGRYFQRELDTDEVPYSVYRGLRRSDEADHLLLWTIPPATTPGYRVIGAARFVRDEHTARDPFWQMRFAWILPYFRYRHIFSASWPIFLARYHRLQVEPLSLIMKFFLHRKPTWPVTTAQGTPLRLYSDWPGCQHGAMQQFGETFWVCGATAPDATRCESYSAPAPRQRAQEKNHA